MDFNAAVKPLFDGSRVACHGPQKARGEEAPHQTDFRLTDVNGNLITKLLA